MTRQVAIRLGSTGKAQVVADLDEIGKTGDAAFNRVARSAERAGRDADAAIEHANRQASKLAALLPGLNPGKLDMYAGVQEGTRKSAEQSAAVFGAAYEQMERRAEALRMALDPVYAAQQRVNAEMAEARSLVAAGVLSLDDYSKAAWRSHQALDGVADSGRKTGSAFASAAPQIQDLFVQISMGANPLNAFIVQGGQLAGQLQYAQGKVGSFASFLMGPWGVALQVGLLAISPFVDKLWESSKANDEAKKAAEAHRKAILDLADAQGKALLTAEQKQRADIRSIELELKAALATRQRAEAELAMASARLQASRNLQNPGGGAEGGIDVSTTVGATIERQIRDLEATLAKSRSETSRLQQGIENGVARLIGMQVDATSTRSGSVTRRYERDREAAMREFSGDRGALEARLRGLTRARDEELDRIKKQEEAERKLGEVRRDGETLTANAVAKMLRGAIPGVQITSTTGGKHVQNSYHYRPGGQAVDFVPAGGMSSMTKADVRRIFESRGIDIVELLGPGDKGHSDHFHVAWTKGKLSLDDFNDAAKRTQDQLESLMETVAMTRDVDVSAMLKAGEQRYREAVRDLVGDSDPLAGKVMGGQEMKSIDDADREVENRRLELGKERIASLASFYQDVFNGGTNSVWSMFRSLGLRTLSDLLAKWTLGKGGDGVGGLMGLLGLAGKGGPSSASIFATQQAQTSSLVASLPKLASGTEYWSGGAALLGEHGPEVASLPRGTRVTPANDTRRLFAANDRGPTQHTHIHLKGAVMFQDVLDQMNALANGAAARGAVGGAQMAEADASAKAMRGLGRRW